MTYDATNSDNIEEMQVDASSVSTTETSKRGSWSVSDDGNVTYSDADGNVVQSYDLSAIPANVVAHNAYIGFTVVMGRSKDMEKSFAAMMAGEITTRKSGKAEVKISPWRLAIANAMVDAKKKSDAPLTLDEAKIKALALTTDQVRSVKTDAAVAKHYNKANGASPSVSALLG